MWFESDLLNILVVLFPVLLLMWLDGLKGKSLTNKNMQINPKSEVKRVQFLNSPFQGKGAQELKERVKAQKESQPKAPSQPEQPSAMKRLIALISTKGKTPQQIKEEVWVAYQKYQKVKTQVESQPKAPSSNEQPQQKEELEFLVKLPLDVDEPQDKQANPGEEMQVIFHRKNPRNPKSNDKN